MVTTPAIRTLLDRAEHATHTLLNRLLDTELSPAALVDIVRMWIVEVEQWARETVPIMRAAGCRETDISRFSVLVLYEESHLKGVTALHGRYRDQLAEQIVRLRAAVEWLEDHGTSNG